jgi:repressor LexA
VLPVAKLLPSGSAVTLHPNTRSEEESAVNLTDRQRDILEFLNLHVERHGYPPTVREIGQAVGLTSPSTVHSHLAALERAGRIRRDATKPRALEVIEGGRSRESARLELAMPVRPVGLPLVGEVAAGAPVVAEDQIEDYVSVPEQVCSDGDFLLRIRGESMINAGILPGDLVVVRRQQDARDGEIVVALVGDEDATVKRFFRDGRRVRLQPENDSMEPTFPEQVAILGKVQAVLRRL